MYKYCYKISRINYTKNDMISVIYYIRVQVWDLFRIILM